MPLSFTFTDTSDYSDLVDYRDDMGALHNPLYMWGNIADFSDDEIDGLLGISREKSIRDKNVIPAIGVDRLLSYFVEIGVNPAYILPISNLGYPEPIVQTVIEVARSDRFSTETRKEAMNALRGIQSMFDDFAREYKYPERVESIWSEFNPDIAALKGGCASETLCGFFDSKVDVGNQDSVLLMERKFSLYEEYLESLLSGAKSKREQARKDKKKYNRRINDARLLLFGDDDGEFAAGFKDAEEFLFECLEQPQFKNLNRANRWKAIAQIIIDPKSEFRKFLYPGIARAYGRIGEGRFFGWPSIGREYAEAYHRYGDACDALKDAKQEVENTKTELDHFEQFQEFINGEAIEFSLYCAKHMVDVVDMIALNNDIYDFMPPILHPDNSLNES